MANPAYIDPATNILIDGDAWVSIGHTSLGSDASTVVFSSPDDASSTDWAQFMDVVLLSYGRASPSGVLSYFYMRINESDDSDAIYPYQKFWGNSSSVNAEASAGATTYGLWMYTLGSSAGANEMSAHVSYFSDINSGKYTSFFGMDAAESDGDGQIMVTSQTYFGQLPMRHLEIFPLSGTIKAGSMFSLFGILPRMVS